MKIIKLSVEHIRYLHEGYHVVYGSYEYWMYLKDRRNDIWRTGFKRKHIHYGTIEEVKVVC